MLHFDLVFLQIILLDEIQYLLHLILVVLVYHQLFLHLEYHEQEDEHDKKIFMIFDRMKRLFFRRNNYKKKYL